MNDAQCIVQIYTSWRTYANVSPFKS